MRSTTLFGRFIGLLALFSVSACTCQKAVAEEVEVHSFEVTTSLVTDTDITAEYVAQVHAAQHIELRALEKGYLEGIFVDEGQSVKKGQRMFQLMPAVYDAELKREEAEAEFAHIEYENVKKLADGKIVSMNELALAKAKMSKADAELKLAQVHRSLTDIHAPFDGLMDKFHVRKGSLLDEGELLTTLSDNSKLWVYFNVTESEYLDYKNQMAQSNNLPAKLVMANGKQFAHDGVVDTIEADFNSETGTIAFRATFPNPEGLLRHGETGKVLIARSIKDARIIPQKATFEVLDKKLVFVVDKDNIVHTRAIVVAEEIPQLYVIASGLADGEKVLIDGLKKVRDGDKIEPRFIEPKTVMSHLEVHSE
jgi:membrane fusion protein, multidrug efflux system